MALFGGSIAAIHSADVTEDLMASRSAMAPSHVPVEITSFVGRRHDLAAVRQLCSTARLVTLTGIGGVGKTRVAYRVAHELRRAFPDGVILAELSALTDPALLPHTVLDALAIKERSPRSPVTTVLEHLASRRVLLILDNCEHLVEAVADFADQVLRTAPDVRILATSRQALRIAGEYVYPVAPLPAPHPETTIRPGTALQYPSVTLFAERAAAVVPDFTITPENEDAVVRLCQRLEGIPLAIELAAVRLRVLTPAELVDRLDDRFALLREGSRNLPQRHQTLRALVDWSHDLCTETEQALWARVSVFAGGFALDAIEAVCTDEALPPAVVLDAAAALVDKSIILRDEQAGQLRFRMLETLRAYGQKRLEEDGRLQEFGRRHRDWALRLVETAGDEWAGPHQAEWASRLATEHANLRRALEFCMSGSDDARIGLRLAAVSWFWGGTGHLSEGRLWLDRALALDPTPSRERAWALATAAYLATLQGDQDAMATLPEAALRLARELDDHAAIAYALHMIGMRESTGPDPAGAIPYFSEALEGYLHAEVQAQYPDSLRIELAATQLFVGQVDEASAHIDILFARCTANEDRWNLSYAHWGRGYVAVLRGQLEQAEADLHEALAIKREFHDTVGCAFILELLAWTAAAGQDATRAATLFGAVDGLWETVVGKHHLTTQRQPYEAGACRLIGETAFEAAHGRGRAMSTEEAVALGLREELLPQKAEETPTTSPVTLTRRQREVAELVAAGMSNKDIAARLVISLRTAEGHVEGILTKLGFSSRAQIASWVAQQGSKDC